MLIKRILSLYDYTGVWSQPYREAGYDVTQIDLQHGRDVRLLTYPKGVHGILAAPPCTHFAQAGSQWWKRKGTKPLKQGLALVDACLRFVAVCNPAWWVLENPRGRITDYLGPHRFEFDPWEFAGLADEPQRERYTKRTLLWGHFRRPLRKPLPPVRFTITRMGVPTFSTSYTNYKMWSGDPRRSTTPQGFARAFFAANP
jgi:hypothetical protein